MADREEIKELKNVIEAWEDERWADIEWKPRRNDFKQGWRGLPEAENLLIELNEYRIKPKPREIWVVEDRVFFNSDAASDYELTTSGKFVRKYREVLDDE